MPGVGIPKFIFPVPVVVGVSVKVIGEVVVTSASVSAWSYVYLATSFVVGAVSPSSCVFAPSSIVHTDPKERLIEKVLFAEPLKVLNARLPENPALTKTSPSPSIQSSRLMLLLSWMKLWLM